MSYQNVLFSIFKHNITAMPSNINFNVSMLFIALAADTWQIEETSVYAIAEFLT